MVGDRIGGVDDAGSLYIWKINQMYHYSRPLHTFGTTQKKVIQDFVFLDHGSTLGVTGSNPKPYFTAYDTFLPY